MNGKGENKLYIRYKVLNDDMNNFYTSELAKFNSVEYQADLEAALIHIDGDKYPILMPMTSEEYETFLDEVCEAMNKSHGVIEIVGGVAEWLEYNDYCDEWDNSVAKNILRDAEDRITALKNINSRLLNVNKYTIRKL